MNRYFPMLLTLALLVCNIIYCQDPFPRPHLLVTDEDRQQVIRKIETQSWAKAIFSNMEEDVKAYADRHVREPEWILSRYLMNRVQGKRYTKAYCENQGLFLTKLSGDAPVPTVRVSPHIRGPVTASGYSYRKPSIEELVPYDTSRLMYLTNLETNRKEWIDPQAFVADINGDINGLALDAAIIYWLNGEEKYAKFAADILDQWAKGAYYQEPIIGPCRTGYLDMQTLGDGAYRSLILAYDFVFPYMKKKGYELRYYETVFEKFASTLAFRGFWNNNWYAAESSTMVFASLSLEDRAKRDYYLQFFLEKDTIRGSCGQLALPSTVDKWLTHDGHWKEPGGYHNYPVGNLLIAALAMEKNGYDIFRRFPALFKASYAMLKYSFPNLTVSAFGDTGRASQSPESLEIGILGAVKYNQPELPEMLSSMKKLIEGGRYRRESSGYLGLLCYLPEIPEARSDYSWPRSGTLDFAKYFLQRNGTDNVTGLMYGVQGASYNHNHCNGMAMELYGVGEVMGIDAGSGPTYEHPLHVNYYSQWAAHNTVAASGSSSAVPFSGSAGRKNIGEIQLAAMEPMPDREAVSAFCSFTDTRYFDQSTGTNQGRTMAIVRTSDKSGYYVDIYRSDNPVSNDYIYHNIGDSVLFLNKKREMLKTESATYPLTGKDYPGFRFFSDVRKLENHSADLIALFPARDDQGNEVFMQVLIPGAKDRTYFSGKSPRTRTSGRHYSGKTVPLFTMRDMKESSSNPFIAVFEPYGKANGFRVDSISAAGAETTGNATSFYVNNSNGDRQLILQSADPEEKISGSLFSFSGYFGVAGFSGSALKYLYLGRGSEISYNGYSLKPMASAGSANLLLADGKYFISCNQPTLIFFPGGGYKSAVLREGQKEIKLRIIESNGGFSITVPATRNGEIRLSTGPYPDERADWASIRSVKDVFVAYPERMKALLESFNLDYQGLEKVKSAYLAGNYEKACKQILEYYRRSKSGSNMRLPVPEVSGERDMAADSVAADIFTFYNQPFKVPRDIYGHLNWACQGPSNDIEWAWGLNRHYHINLLLEAYFRTGNPNYAVTIDNHIKDWVISSLPYPGVKSSTEMWRGLEVSFRVKAWARVFYGLIQSEYLSDATRLLLLSSIPEHTHYARNFHAQGNWLTMEISGLATAATSWPELRQSKEWTDYSLRTMADSFEDQVYPDGVQTELTSSYHLVALNNFSLFMDICNVAGVPVPGQFSEGIEKMWNYTAYTMKPDGFGLLNNDADLMYNRDRVIRAARQFGREDWLYIASGGEKGVKPAGEPSVVFPWAGQLIMRSGFDRDAHHAFFDVGPWGTGHQHNDKLHLSLSAYGKDFLVDAGRFAYRGEVADRFRRYATGSLSHNVVIPDGCSQSAGPTKVKKPLDPGTYKVTQDYDFASGSFDRYTGLEGSFRHNRSVLYVRGMFWVVLDHFSTDRARQGEILWHFHPDCRITSDRNVLTAVNSSAFLKVLPVTGTIHSTELIRGQLKPFPQGWYSKEYNMAEPSVAAVVNAEIKDGSNVVWIIRASEDQGESLTVQNIEEGKDGVRFTIRMSSGGAEKLYDLFMPFVSPELVTLNLR